MKPVAIEHGLDPVKSYLEQKGCQVVEWSPSSAHSQACCVVVTGADENLMGMQDVQVECPVVSCNGLSPEDVYKRIQSYLH